MQLSILDAITEPGGGFFGEGGVSAQTVATLLAGTSPLEQVELTLNSPGGSVSQGIAIYNMLSSRPGGCSVTVVGIAASIASLIAMAASPGKLRIAEGSVLMVHNPRAHAFGEEDDLRATADTLALWKRQMVGIYARRSGMTPAKCEALMASETWMDADEAIRLGLADAKVEPLQMAASAHDPTAFDWLKPRPRAQHRISPVIPIAQFAR